MNKYEKPIIDIIDFQQHDIVTLSGDTPVVDEEEF